MSSGVQHEVDDFLAETSINGAELMIMKVIPWVERGYTYQST